MESRLSILHEFKQLHNLLDKWANQMACENEWALYEIRPLIECT
jgi:hypothetical protein